MTAKPPHVEGVEHHQIEISGLRLHVAMIGEGEPLLMLHGWPQHWYMWHALIPHFAMQYKVICPDFRGFGWSDAPYRGYKKEQLADDILALLDRLGLEKVRLMGHDWGGWVGFLLCLRQPERFQRYVALGILPPWQRLDLQHLINGWRFGYQFVLSAPLLGQWLVRQPSIIHRGFRSMVAQPEQWPDERIAVYSERLQEPARARASALLYRTAAYQESIELMRGRYQDSCLRVPTLLLLGRHDRVAIPALVRGYEPHVEQMEVEVIESSGHFLPEEEPQLVGARARDFIE
jgi:pimeloyl-ACP methyl ester carboxylesterase